MRRFLTTSLLLAVAVSLAGCTTPAPTASPSPSSTSTPKAPVETPTPTPTPTAEALSCDSLTDDATVAKFEADNWVESADFGERLVAEGNPLAVVITYGGVACQWGIPQSDASAHYSYSPLTAAQRGELTANLVAAGAEGGEHPDGEYFVSDPETDYPNFWVVGDDFVAEASTKPLLEMVLENRPTT